MAVIKLTQLGGLYPSILPRNLPSTGAQVADNLDAATTEFRPLAADTTVFSQLGVAANTAANPKTLYRFDRTAGGALNSDDTTGWRSTADFVNVVKSQLTSDAYSRIYYTHENGASPAQVLGADGSVRQLGVPAPTIKAAVTLNEEYTFSPDAKVAELATAREQAVTAVRTAGITRALVGLGNLLPAPGWLRQSDFSTEAYAEKNLLRVFAINPSTNAVIATYSDMPTSEAAWIFDPALGGYAATAPVGYTLPAWASGHTKWWCIVVRGFAEAFDIDAPTLSTALQAIDMPGTQGAQPLLSSTDANTIASRISAIADKDAPAVRPLVETLEEKQQLLASMFSKGGAAQLSVAVSDFYDKADVAASIEAAKDAYALAIWRYVEMIGTATATPFYGGEAP